MATTGRPIFIIILTCSVFLVNAGVLKMDSTNADKTFHGNHLTRNSSIAHDTVDGNAILNKSNKFSSTSSIQFRRKQIPSHKLNLNSLANHLQSRYRQDSVHGGPSKDFESSPEEKHNRRLLTALSKIAVVRVADKNLSHTNRTNKNVIFKNAEDSISKKKRLESVHNSTMDEEVGARKVDEFSASFPMKNVKAVRRQQDTQRFHCYGIREVYIPEVRSRIPAYACRFGERSFILSSPTFQQDHRNYVHVDVNGEVIQQLTQASISATSDFETKIIPAILILKSDSNGYKIQALKNDPLSGHAR